MVTSSRPTHMHFRMPSAATPDWRALDRKLKTLSQAPDAYVLKDDRGIEALVEMPDDDGRKPEEFARFLRNELSKSFGCVYSARTPALRLRLLGDDKVLDAAEAFALAAQAEPGVLAAKVISPARARAFLPQRPRFHQLGIDPSLAMDALVALLNLQSKRPISIGE